jgi:hypothetical protein
MIMYQNIKSRIVTFLKLSPLSNIPKTTRSFGKCTCFHHQVKTRAGIQVDPMEKLF